MWLKINDPDDIGHAVIVFDMVSERQTYNMLITIVIGFIFYNEDFYRANIMPRNSILILCTSTYC